MSASTDTSKKLSGSWRPDRRADTWPPLAAAGGATLMLLWASGSGFRQDLVVLTLTYGLIALGMYVPVLGGSMSMAYSAFAAIGGFTVGLVSQRTGWGLWAGWLAGAAIAAFVATGLALATRRLSGFFLAAVTLLFGIAMEYLLGSAEGITGGVAGISGIRELHFMGAPVPRMVQLAMAAVFVLLLTFAIDRLRRSSWGVLLRAMEDRPLSVEAGGVRTANLATIALAAGAATASLGGALFASFVRGITPETFTLHIVFLALFMPLIGGRGSAWGALLGAVLVVQLTLNFDAIQASGSLLLALAVLVIVLVAPSGIVGWINALWHRIISRRHAHENG